MADPANASPLTICAIVVTLNRLEKFRRTLLRLLEEPVDQIIVADNGSTDGTRDWLSGLKPARLTVLHFTLRLAKAGFANSFEPRVRFEHGCATALRSAAMRPFWKTYYHHRNLLMVYRLAAGACCSGRFSWFCCRAGCATGPI